MAETRQDTYARLATELGRQITAAPDAEAAFQFVCERLNKELATYNWVGVYVVKGDELQLKAWTGPAATEHVCIPLNEGICGWAASTGETVIVDDVSQDERYMQCFLNTRSEIVVPIKRDGVVLGEIDVDGDLIGAFGKRDRRLLEEIAASLATRMAAGAV